MFDERPKNKQRKKANRTEPNSNQIEPIRTPSNVQNTKNGDVVVIKSKFCPQKKKANAKIFTNFVLIGIESAPWTIIIFIIWEILDETQRDMREKCNFFS